MKAKRKNGQRVEDQKEETTCLRALIAEQQPDVLCLQETKTDNPADLDEFADWFPHRYLNHCRTKRGYSGVALLCREAPEWVTFDADLADADTGYLKEGRMIAAKFSAHILVTLYTINAQAGLARIADRLQWEAFMRSYLQKLHTQYDVPVILCGDLNVAPEDRDIHSKQSRDTPGASDEERAAFQQLLQETGMLDTYRHLHPNERSAFTFWSYFAQSRARNRGWRLDFVMVSQRAADRIRATDHLVDYMGSDHCPVLCELEGEAASASKV
jgi:exodeoxyribonuclease-3